MKDFFKKVANAAEEILFSPPYLTLNDEEKAFLKQHGFRVVRRQMPPVMSPYAAPSPGIAYDLIQFADGRDLSRHEYSEIVDILDKKFPKQELEPGEPFFDAAGKFLKKSWNKVKDVFDVEDDKDVYFLTFKEADHFRQSHILVQQHTMLVNRYAASARSIPSNNYLVLNKDGSDMSETEKQQFEESLAEYRGPSNGWHNKPNF